MSTPHPSILISNKTEGGYDTLYGNQAADKLVGDQEELIKAFKSLGYTATQKEVVPDSLHLEIRPPLTRGAAVEIALAAQGINTVVSGHETADYETDDTVVLFMPPHLAKTCISHEIDIDLGQNHTNSIHVTTDSEA